MQISDSQDVTHLLVAWGAGDQSARDRLMALVYGELQRLARRYMARDRGHTLQATALVHEAYLKMIDQRSISWQNRAHFLAIAALLMRRIVMKEARRRHTVKRGGMTPKLRIDEDIDLSRDRAADLIALDNALESLAAMAPQQSRIIELRFFGGLTVEETAEILGISTATVKREWRTARAWLHSKITRTKEHHHVS